ncbi:MAG: DUF1080 domain-containing protein [Verrucomicrobiota bacterium]
MLTASLRFTFFPFSILTCVLLTVLHADEVPLIMGDWQGAYIDAPPKSYGFDNPSIVAQVVGVNGGAFHVKMMNAFERRANLDFEKVLKPLDGIIQYKDKQWEFELGPDGWKGKRTMKRGKGKVDELPFELKRVVRISQTLRRKAPEGADVILPADTLSGFEHGDGKPATWELLPGGVLETFPRKEGNKSGGHLFTKNVYADCEIHLEFKLPYEPEHSGQGRGNSGIFIQNAYEVQILDSYGFESGWTEAGSIYRVAPSKVNRSRPPGQWQTYDITFRAAQFDESGKLIQAPEITVYHNGELIHKDQEIFERSGFTELNRLKPHIQGPAPILLQDHGHRIQFRNFWVKSL